MLTEKRYKQLMEDVGLPNSNSLLRTLKQCAMEATLIERERCAKIAERYEPDEKQEYITYASRDIRDYNDLIAQLEDIQKEKTGP